MRLSRTMAAIAAGVAVALAVAPAASAYDRDAYTYAAGHMIERSDIPKALGSYGAGLDFGANPGVELFLCYLPSSVTDDPGTDVKVGKSDLQFTASYAATKDLSRSVEVQVLQYGSASKAISAFDTLKTAAKKCNGTGSSTWTAEDGVQYENSWQVSTSTVPGVSVVGVTSLGITQDNLSTNSASPDKFVNDNYSVYSLVNDVIIKTTHYTSGTTNLTTAQRKAVNQVAFNAIGRWVG